MTVRNMCRTGTPVDDHLAEYGLLVKREDKCCPGGPNFSKTRGVWSHVRARNESVIGVLDTVHSQAGWAVARACDRLGKRCVVYWPRRKQDEGQPVRPQQLRAEELGATLVPLQAGRSAILYHQARKLLRDHEALNDTSYMMPNALKLDESVTETAREVGRTPEVHDVSTVIVPASSATLAAGVIRGLSANMWTGNVIVHLGYSRSHDAVTQYVLKSAFGGGRDGDAGITIQVVDEGYSYADKARDGDTPPWPCDAYYDLKAFRWWISVRTRRDKAMLWNIG